VAVSPLNYTVEPIGGLAGRWNHVSPELVIQKADLHATANDQTKQIGGNLGHPGLIEIELMGNVFMDKSKVSFKASPLSKVPIRIGKYAQEGAESRREVWLLHDSESMASPMVDRSGSKRWPVASNLPCLLKKVSPCRLKTQVANGLTCSTNSKVSGA
jgi:hypothetical protein